MKALIFLSVLVLLIPLGVILIGVAVRAVEEMFEEKEEKKKK